MNAPNPVPDNMLIWEAVAKTNPANTKRVNQRGGFTAINAHSQVMEATRQFGPIGVGWGFFAADPIRMDELVIVPVTLWHGEQGNHFGPIFGAAELHDSKGRLDSDAPKKATTDGLTKGLSLLGFNADVFLGLYDDNKYVERVTQEFQAEKAEKPEPVPGIHKIKERLRTMMTAGNEDITLAQFKELKRQNRADLKTIRDAGHAWWTGDGEDFEGFGPWIARREAELDTDSMAGRAISDMKENCSTPEALDKWLGNNSAFIEKLDGAESRRFQAAYDAFAAELADRCVRAG